MYVVICKIDHCIHIHWCIVMGLGHNDPWVESHMWPQQTWGQRSRRGQWPLVQVFGKKDQCIHILWCIFKSNITIIAKVCARESRRDSWFENRLVKPFHFTYCNAVHLKVIECVTWDWRVAMPPWLSNPRRAQHTFTDIFVDHCGPSINTPILTYSDHYKPGQGTLIRPH